MNHDYQAVDLEHFINLIIPLDRAEGVPPAHRLLSPGAATEGIDQDDGHGSGKGQGGGGRYLSPLVLVSLFRAP